MTTNTVKGKAYGAKLSNASRLVKVMNTQIHSKSSSIISHPITSSVSTISHPIASVFKPTYPSVVQSFSKIPNSIPTSQTHPITSSISTISHPIASVFKPTYSNIISHPIIPKSSIVEPKQSVST